MGCQDSDLPFLNTVGMPTATVRCTTSSEGNWVEVGAIDQNVGQPIPNLPYKIFDINTKEELASGVLNEKGESSRHQIPVPNTQLFVIFGTDEAIEEAIEQIEALQTQQALQANAVSEWRGFKAGLSREEFNVQHRRRAKDGDFIDADRGFLEGVVSGDRSLGDFVSSILSGDNLSEWAKKEYTRRRDDAWEQYQLVTGARIAGSGESFGAGTAQGITFGFDDEIGAALRSLFDERSYEELIGTYRHTDQQRQISNPKWHIGGEIAGAIPTIFIPVGGAAANTARAGKGIGATIISSGKTGAVLGGISGAGHDEGGILDRLDGAGLGALTGGIGSVIFSGAGVLIARGISKTRIWARIRGREIDPKLLDELTEKGIKHTPEDIVAIRKLDDGRMVFIEKGNESAGLQHILNHADEFNGKGISNDMIPDFIMRNLEEGKIIGYQGKGTGRPIYELIHNGEKYHTAITTGSNGFVVGANPVSVK